MTFDKQLCVNEQELYKALGYVNKEPDDAVKQVICDAIEKLSRAAMPKWLYKRCILNENYMLTANGVSFALHGNSIRKWLHGCTECFMFCVTLGYEVDTVLRTVQTQDMQLAFIMDTAASILAENYTQAADDELVRLASEDRKYTTMRFSPGYGDLPLETNCNIVRLLDSVKLIGLTVQPKGALTPQKSVIAIKGILNNPAGEKEDRCTNCPMVENCEYRKKGVYCGGKNI